MPRNFTMQERISTKINDLTVLYLNDLQKMDFGLLSCLVGHPRTRDENPRPPGYPLWRFGSLCYNAGISGITQIRPKWQCTYVSSNP